MEFESDAQQERMEELRDRLKRAEFRHIDVVSGKEYLVFMDAQNTLFKIHASGNRFDGGFFVLEETASGSGAMFELTVDHHREINKFIDDHVCSVTREGAIGGKVSYSFTPTNLGTVIKVVCACGTELDLTDYTDW